MKIADGKLGHSKVAWFGGTQNGKHDWLVSVRVQKWDSYVQWCNLPVVKVSVSTGSVGDAVVTVLVGVFVQTTFDQCEVLLLRSKQKTPQTRL